MLWGSKRERKIEKKWKSREERIQRIDRKVKSWKKQCDLEEVTVREMLAHTQDVVDHCQGVLEHCEKILQKNADIQQTTAEVVAHNVKLQEQITQLLGERN